MTVRPVFFIRTVKVIYDIFIEFPILVSRSVVTDHSKSLRSYRPLPGLTAAFKKALLRYTLVNNLLPSRSEQHEVLMFGSFWEGILQARH